MRATIQELAVRLSLSEKALDAHRKTLRMKHGKDTERELLKWLEHVWEENRDKMRLLPRRVSDYVESPFVAMSGSADPGEAVPRSYQDALSESANATFSVLKGEERARREVRNRAERLRQAELELRQKGKSAEHYARAVDEVIAAMRAEARAA